MEKTRHLGVYGLIIQNKKIALVLKSRGAYTGKLDLPGGSIEHGETPIETLKREIKEELNCEVKESKLFDVNSVVVRWNHNNIEDELHHIGMFYTAILKDNNLKDDSDGFDSLGADWYLIDKLKEEDVSPLTWIELKKLGYK